MSSEIAVRDGRDAVEDYRSEAVHRLGEWAESARAAHEVATQLVQTSFVPEAFRGKAHEATAAILAGSEVGLSPMASLRSFDIIQGTAAPRAITLRAIVQSQGHEVVVTESTASRAIVKARRRNAQQWQTVTWTLDRAKGLGLLGKNNWKSQPQAMLVARATSEACRLVAADAILGVAYSVEDIDDGESVDVAAPTLTADAPAAAPTGTRRMSRKKPEPTEPDLDEPATEAAVEVVEPDSITDQQMKKIGALMGKNGLNLTDRADALDYVAQVIGREVGSRNELSKAEASDVIDRLETDVQAAAADPADGADPWAGEQDGEAS